MIEARLEWEQRAAPVLEQLRIRQREPYANEREIVDAEPPCDESLMLAATAFHDLSTCRQIGLAIGPIPITAIWQWCDRNGLDEDATAIMTRAIRHADVWYLGEMAKRTTEKGKA